MRSEIPVLASAVLLLALPTGGCASHRCPAGAAGEANEVTPESRARIVQVIHRHARLENGQLVESAIAELADRAIQDLTGEAFPLDGWASLIPAKGALTVLATPEEGLLARAVIDRIRLAAGREGAVIMAGDGDDPGSGPVLWVVEAAWRDPGLTLDPAETVRSRFFGIRFAGVLVDLLEPRINGEPWRADAVLAASDPDTAALGLRHILRARRSGEMGDPKKEAAALNLDPSKIEWVSEVIAR